MSNAEADKAFIFFIWFMVGLFIFVSIINSLQHLFSTIPANVCGKCDSIGTIYFVKTSSEINNLHKNETTYHFKCKNCNQESKQTYQTKYTVR